MSDIQVSNSSDLTAYNVDGLELFFTANRKVRASQNAIARMCDKSQGAVYAYIQKLAESSNREMDVLRVQTQTPAGLRPTALYTSEVIAKCLAKYHPDRLSQFMAFGIDEGLAQMAGVPLPTQPEDRQMPMTELEMATRYVTLLQEKAKVELYLEDKPGLAHKLSQAHAQAALPCEKLSFDEMCELRGIAPFEVNVKRELSRKLANSVSNDVLAAVETKTVTIHREGKKPNYYKVKAYPVEALANFDNVMANHN